MKKGSIVLQNQNWINGSLYYHSVKIMYNFISSNSDLLEYIQWKNDFINIHGFLDTPRKIDIPKMANDYDIELRNEDEIFQLLFCL